MSTILGFNTGRKYDESQSQVTDSLRFMFLFSFPLQFPRLWNGILSVF